MISISDSVLMSLFNVHSFITCELKRGFSLTVLRKWEVWESWEWGRTGLSFNAFQGCVWQWPEDAGEWLIRQEVNQLIVLKAVWIDFPSLLICYVYCELPWGILVIKHFLVDLLGLQCGAYLKKCSPRIILIVKYSVCSCECILSCSLPQVTVASLAQEHRE